MQYDAVHNLRAAANGRTCGTSSRRSGFPNSAYARSGSAYQQCAAADCYSAP